MEFGVFSVLDIKENPLTGTVPTHGERIAAVGRVASHAEEVGLDVFAVQENHKPDFIGSSPAVLLAFIAARTRRIQLSTLSTLITINDPVRLAEEYATLQHLAQGRLDIMVGMRDTVSLPYWSAPETQVGVDLALENYELLYRLWHEEVVDWDGDFRTPLEGCTASPRPLDGQPPFVWHATSRSSELADQAAMFGDGFFVSNMIACIYQYAELVAEYRQAWEDYGHGRADQAYVSLGGHVFVAKNSQDAVNAFRPFFNASTVYGGLSLEEAMTGTALAVGSPQQVTEKILSFREAYGDYQRQMFWIDQMGLPLDMILDQLDILGTQIVPVLRTEFEAVRSAGVPSDPPKHGDLIRPRQLLEI